MKKACLAIVLVLAGFALLAAEMPLAEARAKIGAVIANPRVMTSIMKKLKPADQATFLADVNAAIASMPVSNEAKAAAFLNVNRAAYRGAASGNLTTLVAETFATVPAEALTLLNERLASDVFNRAGDPTITYTDEQFTKIAELVMKKVNERVATAEYGAVRATFALLMMARASNGTPANLTDVLAETLPEAARETAKSDWIPAALGLGMETQSYESLLAAADNAPHINPNVALRLAASQILDMLLPNVVEGTELITRFIDPDPRGGSGQPAKEWELEQQVPAEPLGYQWQY